MFTDLFSALDCMQNGWLSGFIWATPLCATALIGISETWGQSYTKMIFGLLSTNSETRQKALPGIPLLAFSLMGFILINNLLGLIPFVYGTTSNIWVVSTLALVCWGLLILSGWTKYPTKSSAGLAPMGAPAALIPLLVLIETVSLLIRPLTLLVRLVANISAGHIIMGLLANCCALSGLQDGPFLYATHMGYMGFEIFVAFIQAYIFALLVKLYSEEHPSDDDV